MSILVTGANHALILLYSSLANKQDLPNAKKPSELASYFKNIPKDRLIHIAPTTNIAPLSDSGIPEAFDWLKTILNTSYSKSNIDTPSTVSNPSVSPPGSKADFQSRFESFLSRGASDSPKELFLQQFEAFSLPSWDHYTHIRLAYTILTEYGRQKGESMFPVLSCPSSYPNIRKSHDPRRYSEIHREQQADYRTVVSYHHDLLLDSNGPLWHKERPPNLG